MIKTHRAQRSFGDGLIAEEVKDLHEAWMTHADQLLGDPQIVVAVRNGQKWRTGSEGRISVVKRRHGLNRSRYRGDAGMKRWVGLGVIADNLVNISRAMAEQPGP